MDKLRKVFYVLTLVMFVLNAIFGMWNKDVYYIGIAIIDYMIAMSIKELDE